MRKAGKYLYHLDFQIVIIFLTLVTIGLMSIYASEYKIDFKGIDFSFSKLYIKQLIWIAISLLLFVVILLLDYRFFDIFAYSFYGISILISILVIFIGEDVNGAKSWIDIGFMKIQPSEFTKVATLLTLSNYLSRKDYTLKSIKSVLITFAIILIPFFIVLLQNDLGSGLTFLAFFIILYRVGIPGYFYLGTFITVLVSFLSLVFETQTIVAILFVFTFISYVVSNYSFIKALVSSSLIIVAFIFLSDIIYTSFFNYILVLINVLFIFSILLFYKRIKKIWRHILYPLIFIFLAMASISSSYVFHNLLKPYQRNRVAILAGQELKLENRIEKLTKLIENKLPVEALNLESYKSELTKKKKELKELRRGPLWNINQSLIAFSSGGFFGKGYLKGTQNKFEFLPEQSTDFIFCTIGEEWGFLGVLVTLALFGMLLFRIISIAEQQRALRTLYFGYGIASLLLVHQTINIGMTIGLLPVIGVPLPFISYGGSSLISFSILIAIYLNFNSNNLNVFS